MIEKISTVNTLRRLALLGLAAIHTHQAARTTQNYISIAAAKQPSYPWRFGGSHEPIGDRLKISFLSPHVHSWYNPGTNTIQLASILYGSGILVTPRLKSRCILLGYDASNFGFHIVPRDFVTAARTAETGHAD